MRRSAFVGVLAAGVLASAWFSMQPLADPYNGAQRASRAQSLLPVAAPAAVEPTAAPVIAPLPERISELSSTLQASLLSGGCLSESEAMTRIMDVTAGADHYTAFAAVREVSAQEHPCGAIDVALGRSRGAFEQTSSAPEEPIVADTPPFFGDGQPVGGGGGPGYPQS